MGAKKAIVAVAHNLLKVIHAVLRTGQPYQERDRDLQHELERQKQVRHCARRLRDLGAEPEAIRVMVERLLCPVLAPETPPPLPTGSGPAEPGAEAGVPSPPGPSPSADQAAAGAPPRRQRTRRPFRSESAARSAAASWVFEPDRQRTNIRFSRTSRESLLPPASPKLNSNHHLYDAARTRRTLKLPPDPAPAQYFRGKDLRRAVGG